MSFLILDTFGQPGWRRILEQYKVGEITIADFNARAFADVKADEATLRRFVRENAEVRPGFRELLAYCREHDIDFAVVSNGLDFYIKIILETVGVDGVDVFAARAQFGDNGIESNYFCPGGKLIRDKFKDAYLAAFQGQGYRVLYAGNGPSDLAPARKSAHIFATGSLLDQCRELQIEHSPFDDFNEVITVLKSLPDDGHRP
jgi:2-hydroxy-3-keto-5-methylthiopentenyl-1-phosphate phosphatase